jgi:hypothetical protein
MLVRAITRGFLGRSHLRDRSKLAERIAWSCVPGVSGRPAGANAEPGGSDLRALVILALAGGAMAVTRLPHAPVSPVTGTSA